MRKPKSSPQLSQRLLDILVCPVSGGKLVYDAERSLLLCHQSGLAYRVKDGIPVMMVDQAIKISSLETKPLEGKPLKANKKSPKAWS